MKEARDARGAARRRPTVSTTPSRRSRILLIVGLVALAAGSVCLRFHLDFFSGGGLRRGHRRVGILDAPSEALDRGRRVRSSPTSAFAFTPAADAPRVLRRLS